MNNPNVTLELPSGDTLQKKILMNNLEYHKEFLRRIEDGEQAGAVMREIEERYKQTLRCLIDKLTITMRDSTGKQWWPGREG